jgi:hypothetical protein
VAVISFYLTLKLPEMHDFVRETVFGRIVHYASGGRLFSMAEQRAISKAQKYAAGSTSTSITFGDTTTDTPETQMVDLENDNKFQLVDWEENDPEV